MFRLAKARASIRLAEGGLRKAGLPKCLPHLRADTPGVIGLCGSLKREIGELAGAIQEQLMVGRGENGGPHISSLAMDKPPGSTGFRSYFADRGSAMLSNDLPSASMPNFSSATAASSSSSAAMP
jgi:hypothetical protein